ncbi:MAG: CoA transferase [Gemmatimonadetes bacterium]|nr:CoA transferase [Gemmatimonadota bacterium]
MNEGGTAPTRPLDGLSVVDFSHALAGPYASMVLATYGANVVKVESLEGDIGRAWGPPLRGPETSYFLGLNTGKQSLAVSLKDPRGVEVCRRLVAQADVLLENFRPGTMTRLGLGYDAVRDLNPRLIYCSISGFGQTGPRRDEPAMDLILQAASGLISVTGTADGETVRSGHSVADVTAGMFAIIGILMALRSRDRTGHGQLVDVSMFDGMISSMASNFANFFGLGQPPRPLGTAFGTVVPYACFPTADRDIAIAVGSDKIWGDFCEAIERPDLAADPRYLTNALRVVNRSPLEASIAEWFRAAPAHSWLERLRRAGVPGTLVADFAEVVADPHAAARGLFPTTAHPAAGEVTVTGPPLKFSRDYGAVESAAPVLGGDTRAVCQKRLGMSPAEVETLLEAGVLRATA